MPCRRRPVNVEWETQRGHGRGVPKKPKAPVKVHKTPAMIGGVHTILFSKKADAVRTFLRDVPELPFVDAGDGWLISRIELPDGQRLGLYEPRHPTATRMSARPRAATRRPGRS